MSARVHGSRLLSLATTVSALHRNARIWNASHPVLVTYYCRVTVYSLGLEAKKDILRGGCMLPPEFETGSARVVIQASAIYAMRTVVPNDSYCTRNKKNADLFKLPITISRTKRKNSTPKMTNSLFTCHLNCMCTFNLVCLI